MAAIPFSTDSSQSSSEPERVCSDEVLAGFELRIQHLKNTKRNLTLQLERINADLKHTRARYGSLVNQKSPVSSIPNEILAMIFDIGKKLLSEDGQSEFLPFEVAVSHVIRRWRQVAIGSSLLWNTIETSPLRPLEELEMYLQRSTTSVLELRVDMSGRVWTANGGAMLGMLISHVGRWGRVSIEADDDSELMRLRDLDAPRLEHMSIMVNGLDRLEAMNDYAFHPQILTGGAPLSFVRLRGHAMSFFRPPLSGATTLHLDQTMHLPMKYTRFREIITASPTLTNLSLYGDLIGTERWNSQVCIDMPALRSLRICGIAGFVYSGILLGISAPILESLTLKDALDHDLDQLWDSPQMNSLFPKFPRLASLTFCDFEFTHSTYKKIFHAFPYITSFTSLHSSLRAPTVLTLLGTSPRWPMVDLPWPQLHTVTFLLSFEDEGLINAMLTNRMTLEHPIGKLRLGTGDMLSHAHIFESLRERVEVESFSEIDPWPDGLKYVDVDDFLF